MAVSRIFVLIVLVNLNSMKRSSWILFIFLSLPALSQQLPNAIQRAQQRTYTIATLPQAGELLTLQQAVGQSVEKNYQVRINRSQEEIARNNYSKGNAGYLPTITGNLNSNGNLQNLRQTYIGGKRPPSRGYWGFNRTSNVGVNLNYTVFNGYARRSLYAQLQQFLQISTVNTRANVEATMAQVATSYYDVVRQVQRFIAFSQALDISRERLELARANYEVGTRSKVDFLSAQVDYNTDSAALLSQDQALRNAKIILNRLLVREPSNGVFRSRYHHCPAQSATGTAPAIAEYE